LKCSLIQESQTTASYQKQSKDFSKFVFQYIK